MTRFTMGVFSWLVAGSTWAQEAPEEPSEADEQSVESSEEAPAIEDASSEPTEEAPAALEASTSPQIKVVVELTNGLRLMGTVAQSDLLTWEKGQALRFTPEGGEPTELTGDRIASLNTPPAHAPSPPPVDVVAEAEPVSDYTSPGGFKYPNPAASRYLYAPSSIPLKKGQGYVSQKWVFTSAAYALSDNLTVLYGAFTFFPPALSVFGAKAGFEVKDGLHISVGGEAFVSGIAQEVPVAIGFGAVTFGNEDKHLTVASGYAGGSLLDDGTMPLMVGGQIRFDESFAFITENWVFFDVSDYADGQGLNSATTFAGSAAFRIVGRRDRGNGTPRGLRTQSGHPRTTWDIGLVGLGVRFSAGIYDEVSGEELESEFYTWEVFAPIPWIDWTWHFGSAGN
jgi:hypothetical protein